MKEAQQQKEEFYVSFILVVLDPALKPYKAQILTKEELPTLADTFSGLNCSFLEKSSMVPSNDSSTLVTSAGGYGSGCGGGRGDGGRGGRDGGHGGKDGDRDDDRRPPQRSNYCGMNGHT